MLLSLSSVALLGTLLLVSCAGRTLDSLRNDPQIAYRFNGNLEAVKTCLVPLLDHVEPFTPISSQTKPALIRSFPAKTEIFAQDADTRLLYLVEIEAIGTTGVVGKAYTPIKRLLPQIAEVFAKCGGSA